MGWWDRLLGRAEPKPSKPGKGRRKKRGYDGASKGRHTEGWTTTGGSGNAEVGAAASTLRARSRDLRRNDPFAASALSKLATRIVGTGIRPRSMTGDEALDKRVNDLWERWSAECSPDGQADINGVMHQAVLGMLESGDAFVRRRLRRVEDGLPVPLQVEILEADMLDTTHDAVPSSEGGVVVQGIEFDAVGRRTGYWLHRSHPGDAYGWAALRGVSSLESTFVPAASIAHLANTLDLRPGQVRGVPHLSPVMRALRELDDYRFAERTRKRAESCVVGSIDGGDSDGFVSAPDDEEEGFWGAEDADGNPVENLQPGLVFEVRDGKRFVMHAPASVGGYAEYIRTELHAIAAGARLPYSLLTGDSSGENYSSMRGQRLEFGAWIESVQWLVVIPRLCRPLWSWFIEAAVASGQLPARDGGYPVEWGCPAPRLIDPQKEVAAYIIAIRAGLLSPQQAAAELGWDLTDILNEIAAANALADSLGLVLDSDPRRTSGSGGVQPTAPNEAEQGEPGANSDEAVSS